MTDIEGDSEWVEFEPTEPTEADKFSLTRDWASSEPEWDDTMFCIPTMLSVKGRNEEMFDLQQREMSLARRTVQMRDLGLMDISLARRTVHMEDIGALEEEMAMRTVQMFDVGMRDLALARRTVSMDDIGTRELLMAGRTVQMLDLDNGIRTCASKLVEMFDRCEDPDSSGLTDPVMQVGLQMKRGAEYAVDMLGKVRMSFKEKYEMLRDRHGVEVSRVALTCDRLDDKEYIQVWDRIKLAPKRLLDGEDRELVLGVALMTIESGIQPSQSFTDNCSDNPTMCDENLNQSLFLKFKTKINDDHSDKISFGNNNCFTRPERRILYKMATTPGLCGRRFEGQRVGGDGDEEEQHYKTGKKALNVSLVKFSI